MSELAANDPEVEYQAYLKRFQERVGDVEIGGFAKHNGQLIQKLSEAEFVEKYTEFHQLYQTYSNALERGDTINDMVVRLIREHAAKLMEEDPVKL